MRALIIALIATIAFVLVGGETVSASTNWECVCEHTVCEWCAATDEIEWAEFHADAFAEYAAEFTALFNATEFKVSKNGRSMVKGPNAKSFKFVKSA